jgi:hypothetical protein
MWPRCAEILLAAWLLASPFVFGHADRPALRWQDHGTALALLLLALLSFVPALRRAHLGSVLVALWLIGLGYAGSAGVPPAPASQNHIAVGLVLSLFAIIPSEATRPPVAWRRHLERHD